MWLNLRRYFDLVSDLKKCAKSLSLSPTTSLYINTLKSFLDDGTKMKIPLST